MITARAALASPHVLPDALVDQLHALLPQAVAGTTPATGMESLALTWQAASQAEVEALGPQLRGMASGYGVDAAVTWGPLAERGPQLLVMDVDSTFITAEVIELLADRAGRRAEVAEVTERAMRGELDFAQSLHHRVQALAGLSEEIFDAVRAEVQLSPGARELVAAVQAAGGHVGLVSGGFVEVVRPLAEPLGIKLIQANSLEIADGRLTGRTRGAVVDRAAKARHLRAYAEAVGADLSRTVAVGDGANDLDMLAAAQLGVAYCAKPVTREASDAAINFPRLDAVRAFVGV